LLIDELKDEIDALKELIDGEVLEGDEITAAYTKLAALTIELNKKQEEQQTAEAAEKAKQEAEAAEKARQTAEAAEKAKQEAVAAEKARQTAEAAEPAAENRETYYIRATKIIAGIVIVANLISLFVDLVLNEGDYGINFAFNAATIFGVVLPILIFGSFFGVIRLPVLSKMTNTYIGAMITALTVGVIPAWLVGLTWSVSYHGSYQFGIGGLIGNFIFLSILIPGPIAIIYRIAYMRLRKANAANVF
jgi:hypothetical protein